jgi:hypothetical protein
LGVRRQRKAAPKVRIKRAERARTRQAAPRICGRPDPSWQSRPRSSWRGSPTSGVPHRHHRAQTEEDGGLLNFARIPHATSEMAWPALLGERGTADPRPEARATNAFLLGRGDVVNPDVVSPLLVAKAAHVLTRIRLSRRDAQRSQQSHTKPLHDASLFALIPSERSCVANNQLEGATRSSARLVFALGDCHRGRRCLSVVSCPRFVYR